MPKLPQSLLNKIAAAPPRHTNENPLWKGPCGKGPLGGITQSMLVRFLSCRERFRLKYVLGLEPHDKWNHRLGYGNMWHVCEEAHAAEVSHFGEYIGTTLWEDNLDYHTKNQMVKYPHQRDEIAKWMNVCAVQFPEYVKYWSDHPDVQNRKPLFQEQVFDVPYQLPSGRVVRLRGKWDSVDLIDGGIWLQENKTKGDIDKQQVERQLRFDLQTMLYLIALQEAIKLHRQGGDIGLPEEALTWPVVLGVRYNVVRRPLSGGVGNIKPHSAKQTKKKYTPAETPEAFFERLRRDYIAKDPAHWFFRVRAEISARDIQVFRDACLDPLLETLCWWYDDVTDGWENSRQQMRVGEIPPPPMNYRTPFGVYSALEEGGATEYDAYLDSGSEAGLRRVHTLFPELQE